MQYRQNSYNYPSFIKITFEILHPTNIIYIYIHLKDLQEQTSQQIPYHHSCLILCNIKVVCLCLMVVHHRQFPIPHTFLHLCQQHIIHMLRCHILLKVRIDLKNIVHVTCLENIIYSRSIYFQGDIIHIICLKLHILVMPHYRVMVVFNHRIIKIHGKLNIHIYISSSVSVHCDFVYYFCKS